MASSPTHAKSTGLPDGLVRALEALHGPRRPMTPEEIAVFEAEKADVAAADERRRMPAARRRVPAVQRELFE